jgi:hypothetical protein
MHPKHQLEYKVVLNSELDSKTNSGIPNLFGYPVCCAHLLGSLAHP